MRHMHRLLTIILTLAVTALTLAAPAAIASQTGRAGEAVAEPTTDGGASILTVVEQPAEAGGDLVSQPAAGDDRSCYLDKSARQKLKDYLTELWRRYVAGEKPDADLKK